MKTSELTGAQLDWAVSLITNPEWGHEYRMCKVTGADKYREHLFSPSTEWAHGGPLIQRETLCLEYDKDWVYDPATADPDDEPDNGDRWMAWPSKNQMQTIYGPTPLIAAMRCFCASHLGDEVEIPKELMT